MPLLINDLTFWLALFADRANIFDFVVESIIVTTL